MIAASRVPAAPSLHDAQGASSRRSGGWDAHLKLCLEPRGERTIIARQSHQGPLRIQRPFYPESDGACHVYILHPPGGIVGGDRLVTELEGAGSGRALFTTPGATKFYRSQGDTADVRQTFRVEGDFCFEWFPQETIAFDGCHAEVRTRAVLCGGAVYAAWDVVCLGRPACEERFTRGCLRLSHAIERDGTLQWLERAQYRAGDPIFEAAWGLSGHAVIGTFVVAAGAALGEDVVQAVRDALSEREDDVRLSLTLVSDVLVVRYLGDQAHEAMALFRRAWSVLRPYYAGQAAVPPRIWNT